MHYTQTHTQMPRIFFLLSPSLSLLCAPAFVTLTIFQSFFLLLLSCLVYKHNCGRVSVYRRESVCGHVRSSRLRFSFCFASAFVVLKITFLASCCLFSFGDVCCPFPHERVTSDKKKTKTCCQGRFSKQLGMSGHYEQALWRNFMVLLCIFFMFANWSPFTSIIWESTATPFSCETPAVFSGLKNLTQPSIGMRVRR